MATTATATGGAKRMGRRKAAKARGTVLPSFSRRGGFAATRRQAGLLAPGYAASLLAARRPAFPDPAWVEWLTWDWLPGYSGGTAPVFDRLPSKALSGATAAGLAVRDLLRPPARFRQGEEKKLFFVSFSDPLSSWNTWVGLRAEGTALARRVLCRVAWPQWSGRREERMENQAGAASMQPVGPAESGTWKKPWVAYNIIDRPGLRSRIWSRVGMAWLNRDGSINVVLDSLPLGGRIQLREDDRDRRPESRAGGALAVAAQGAEE